MQIFFACALCLGMAIFTQATRLSIGFGAFLAGVLIGAAKETGWVHRRLEPFRIFFVAAFFVSIGLLVQLPFIFDHWPLCLALTLAVLVGNTLLNAAIFRGLGGTWRYGLFAGACLAQIGEFSFVLAQMGVSTSLLTHFEYQLTVAVIALSMIASPGWIALIGFLEERGAAGAATLATELE
jgi:CPA2 family monovalent cation:H+ antiporter-2